MGTYRQIYYHLVFGTKDREPVIAPGFEKNLYNYMWGTIKRKNCRLYQINGMADHIHLLTDLHPTLALSDFVKDVKVKSSIWMKQSGYFPLFRSWSEGYGAFTCGEREKEIVIQYIKNQKEHHKIEDSLHELRRLLKENNISFEEKYLI